MRTGLNPTSNQSGYVNVCSGDTLTGGTASKAGGFSILKRVSAFVDNAITDCGDADMRHPGEKLRALVAALNRFLY